MYAYLHMANEGTKKINIDEEDIPKLKVAFGKLIKSCKVKGVERLDIYVADTPPMIRRRLTDYHKELAELKPNIISGECPNFERAKTVKMYIRALDKKLAWTANGLEFLRENDYLKNTSKKHLVKELEELVQLRVDFLKKSIIDTIVFMRDYPREAPKCVDTLRLLQGKLDSYKWNFEQHLSILLEHDIITEKDYDKIMEGFNAYV